MKKKNKKKNRHALGSFSRMDMDKKIGKVSRLDYGVGGVFEGSKGGFRHRKGIIKREGGGFTLARVDPRMLVQKKIPHPKEAAPPCRVDVHR